MAKDPIDELRRTAYPNPDRIGCPSPEAFEALAKRQVAAEDSIWQHIERCSPCYVEFAAIRDSFFQQERRQSSHRILAAASVVVVLIAIGALLFLLKSRNNKAPQSPSLIAENRRESAVLNFEDGSELRGAASDENSRDPSKSRAQHLPRNDLNLTVYLPLGSPAGLYELEIVTPDGAVIWHVQGDAAIRDGLTSVPVAGDLRRLAAGQYRFRFRRSEDSWREKDVIVQ